MGFFDIFKQKQPVKGLIGYYGLADWWMTAFTQEERAYIQSAYNPLGLPSEYLVSAEIGGSSASAVKHLTSMVECFAKDKDRHLAYKILDKAETISNESTDAIDLHFLYMAKIKIYYRDRDKPDGLKMAIGACRQQIDLAPKAARAFRAQYKGEELPYHTGYQQLAIILEKQKKYDEAIDLCAQALKQGWGGDWEKRIERCEKKRAREK